MYIKWSLILIPVILILLIPISALFVPSAQSVSKDSSRLDKIVAYVTADLEQMNPWLSTKTSDSDISSLIFEPLLTADGDYVMEPKLAKTIRLCEEVVLTLDHDQNAADVAKVLQEEMTSRFGGDFEGMIPYEPRKYQGKTKGRIDADFIYDLSQGNAKSEFESDGIQRLVMRFRPDPSKNYGKKEMPNAVVPNMTEILEDLGKSKFAKGEEFVSGYDPFRFAVDSYVARYKLDAAAFQLPSKPEAASTDEAGGEDDKKPEATEAAEVEKAALEAWKKQIEEAKAEWPKKLTKEAKGGAGDIKVQPFEEFLASVPESRIGEYPTVLCQLHEAVQWHDFGTLVPVYGEDGIQVHDLKTKDGTPLPARLESKEDWAKWGGRLIEIDTQGITSLMRTERFAGETREDLFNVKTTYYRSDTLDSKDVAFTFTFGGDPDVNSNVRIYTSQMQQIRLYGDLELEIVYGRLYSPALFDLVSARILPEHRLTNEEWTRQAITKGSGPNDPRDPTFEPRKALRAKSLSFSMDPIGTGPFTLYPLNGEALPRWRTGELVRLERWDNYWNDEDVPPYKYRDYFVFDPELGKETAEVVFRTGGTDFYGIRPEQFEDYVNLRDKFYLYKRLRLNYEYIAFNLDREPFTDLRVRQALAMAVNVEEITKYIAYGQAVRINGPAYPVLPWYDESYVPEYTYRSGDNKGKTFNELGEKYFPFNMTEAAALLEESGWVKDKNDRLMKDGKQMAFDIEISGVQGSRGKIAELVRRRWRELGIKVGLSDSEWNVFVNEKARQRNFDAIVLGWANGISFDKQRLWSSEWLSPKGMNFVGFKNERAEELMRDALNVYDFKGQQERSHELFRIIAGESPYIFTFASVSNIAVSRNIVWARPKRDDKGELVYASDGTLEREYLPINHPDAMKIKYGPNKYVHQWKRIEKVMYPPTDDEPLFAGRPDLGTWGDFLKERKEAEGER